MALLGLGSIDVQVEYKSQVLVVPLIVVKYQSPSLFRWTVSRNKINWQLILNIDKKIAVKDSLYVKKNLALKSGFLYHVLLETPSNQVQTTSGHI